jgi:hypothetical protein
MLSERTLALPLRHGRHATAIACLFFFAYGTARCCPGTSEAGAIFCQRSMESMCSEFRGRDVEWRLSYSPSNLPELSVSALCTKQAAASRNQCHRSIESPASHSSNSSEHLQRLCNSRGDTIRDSIEISPSTRWWNTGDHPPANQRGATSNARC